MSSSTLTLPQREQHRRPSTAAADATSTAPRSPWARTRHDLVIWLVQSDLFAIAVPIWVALLNGHLPLVWSATTVGISMVLIAWFLGALGIDAVEQALADIAAAADLERLKTVRLAHTGEKSPLALGNRKIGKLPKEQKAVAGKLMGQARGRVNKAVAQRQEVLEAEHAERILVEEAVDVTAAGRRRRIGGRHPISLLMERSAEIFVGMGWEVAEGPEVESEWYNFDSLNFKPDHPARQLQDTFFVAPPESHLVLRTHTSPVQMRSLLSRDLQSTSWPPAGSSAPMSSTPPTRPCSTRSRAWRSTRGWPCPI